LRKTLGCSGSARIWYAIRPKKLATISQLNTNTILQQQVDELDEQLQSVQQECRALTGGKTAGSISPMGINYAINQTFGNLNRSIKS